MPTEIPGKFVPDLSGIAKRRHVDGDLSPMEFQKIAETLTPSQRAILGFFEQQYKSEQGYLPTPPQIAEDFYSA